MNIILCEYVNKNEYDAGNKARSDVLAIAEEMGYKHIPLFRSGASKLVVFFQLIRGSLSVLRRVKRNEKVFIQYPYYPPMVNKFLFGILGIGKKLKGYKLELVIHDVIGMRSNFISNNNEKIALAREVARMQSFDKVICHNKVMKAVLESFSLNINFVMLGPFDYLYKGNPISIDAQLPWRIIIAGNLEKNKCGYLYKLPEWDNIQFDLYGMNFEGNMANNANYHGSFPPDELISHLEGHFGLVWDGDSLDTCSGAFGQYLKYNNPHKFSLYLAAGIPLIVWDQSALAEYVQKYNLGLCVSSLTDIEDMLSCLSSEAYREMKNNVMAYREGIIAGRQLKQAIGTNE